MRPLVRAPVADILITTGARQPGSIQFRGEQVASPPEMLGDELRSALAVCVAEAAHQLGVILGEVAAILARPDGERAQPIDPAP